MAIPFLKALQGGLRFFRGFPDVFQAQGRAEARPPRGGSPRGGPRFVAAARTGCCRHVPEAPRGDDPDEAGPSRVAVSDGSSGIIVDGED